MGFGNFNEALEIFVNWTEIDGENPEAWTYAACAAEKDEKYDRAVELAEKGRMYRIQNI